LQSKAAGLKFEFVIGFLPESQELFNQILRTVACMLHGRWPPGPATLHPRVDPKRVQKQGWHT
jgi:hypothetical protein